MAAIRVPENRRAQVLARVTADRHWCAEIRPVNVT